jgi:tetratricopeptide (TPR) repeat protein
MLAKLDEKRDAVTPKLFIAVSALTYQRKFLKALDVCARLGDHANTLLSRTPTGLLLQDNHAWEFRHESYWNMKGASKRAEGTVYMAMNQEPRALECFESAVFYQHIHDMVTHEFITCANALPWEDRHRLIEYPVEEWRALEAALARVVADPVPAWFRGCAIISQGDYYLSRWKWREAYDCYKRALPYLKDLDPHEWIRRSLEKLIRRLEPLLEKRPGPDDPG